MEITTCKDLGHAKVLLLVLSVSPYPCSLAFATFRYEIQQKIPETLNPKNLAMKAKVVEFLHRSLVIQSRP